MKRGRPTAGNEKQPGKTAEERAVIRTTQNISIGKMPGILLSLMAYKTTEGVYTDPQDKWILGSGPDALRNNPLVS